MNLKIIADDLEQRSKNAAFNRLKNAGYPEDEAEAYIFNLFDRVPNLKGTLKRFTEGIVRWFMQGDLNAVEEDYRKLNLLLMVLQNSPANDALNQNFVSVLTGVECSYKQVLDMLDMSDDFVDTETLTTDHEYEVVEVTSYEQLQPYRKYVSKWCVNSSEDVFNHYTQDGEYRFFLCLRDDYKSVPPVPQESYPKDDYGLSIIAVILDQYGNVMNTTSRWNATNEGDSFLTEAEVRDYLPQKKD